MAMILSTRRRCRPPANAVARKAATTAAASSRAERKPGQGQDVGVVVLAAEAGRPRPCGRGRRAPRAPCWRQWTSRRRCRRSGCRDRTSPPRPPPPPAGPRPGSRPAPRSGRRGRCSRGPPRRERAGSGASTRLRDDRRLPRPACDDCTMPSRTPRLPGDRSRRRAGSGMSQAQRPGSPRPDPGAPNRPRRLRSPARGPGRSPDRNRPSCSPPAASGASERGTRGSTAPTSGGRRPRRETSSASSGRDRRPLGYATFSDRSVIALRLLTHEDARPDAGFWRARIEAAVAYRESLGIDATAYRLIHGEGDRLPGLIVDRYGESLVVQTLTQATARLLSVLCNLLVDAVAPAGILARNDPRVRSLEGPRPEGRAAVRARGRGGRGARGGGAPVRGPVEGTEDRPVPGSAGESPGGGPLRPRTGARRVQLHRGVRPADGDGVRGRARGRRVGGRGGGGRATRRPQRRCARRGPRRQRVRRPARPRPSGGALRRRRARPAPRSPRTARRWSGPSPATRRSTCAPCASSRRAACSSPRAARTTSTSRRSRASSPPRRPTRARRSASWSGGSRAAIIPMLATVPETSYLEVRRPAEAVARPARARRESAGAAGGRAARRHGSACYIRPRFRQEDSWQVPPPP